MRNIYRSLLLLIAGATQQELARHVRYLKIENQILRSKLPKRVTLTWQERNRLIRFGAKLGQGLSQLVTIVHPDTLRRWIREAGRRRKSAKTKAGRPRTAADIRRLIIKLAKETGWGYTRILGELRKLGIQSVSRNTVKNILKQNGLDPGPKRGLGTWDEFLKIHAATLWQCDFASKKVLTPKGLRDLFVLVFLHVGIRRVFVTPSTFHPNEDWVLQQAAAFIQHIKQTAIGAVIVLHDRDTKFTASFDAALRIAGLRVQKSAYCSPNTAAFVERFIQTLQQECLDYFVVFVRKHFDHLISEMVAHYHQERPHKGLANELLAAHRQPKSPKPRKRLAPEPDIVLVASVGCKSRLGGLLKHYYRKAA